jgi:heat shock protein HslJ
MSSTTRHLSAAAVLGLLCLEVWAVAPIEECQFASERLHPRVCLQRTSQEMRRVRDDGESDTGGMAAVTGAEWHLTRLIFDGAESGLGYSSDSPVTIHFDKSGRVTGRGPINRFSGDARSSSEGRISWTGAGLQTTLMAGPPEAMEREDMLFQILGQVYRYRVNGSQLILETEDSNSSLTFERP